MAEREVIIFIILINIILFVLIIGVILFVIQYRKRKELYRYELAQMKEEFTTELLKTQLTAQKETMIEIGKELHDSMGQKMSLASIYLHKAVRREGDIQVDQLFAINAIIEESLGELREISNALIKTDFTKLSLTGLVTKDIQRIRELNDININLEIGEFLADINAEQTMMLRRVIQEYLQNSIKHSKAAAISLKIRCQGNILLISCSDNGLGFDLETVKKGNGLNNIQSRLDAINAKYQWKTAHNEGTSLEIELKLNEETE